MANHAAVIHMTQSNITLSDIFSSSVLQRAVESFSVIDVLISLMVSLLLGLLIFFVYKHSYTGVMYSRSFHVSLIALVMVSAMVISAVTNNVVLSLGMVGALSIVRFRTAIKDPMDIVYLFWSIATGIIVGAGMLLIALLSTLVIALVIYGISVQRLKDQPYLLIATLSNATLEQDVRELTKAYTKRYRVKSKSIRMDGICELTYEVCIPDGDTELINRLSMLEGMQNTVLVAYNGDYSI